MGTYSSFYLKSSAMKIYKLPEGITEPQLVRDLLYYGEIHDEKWYDYEEDLLKVSKMHPKLWIIVEKHTEDHRFSKVWILNGIARSSVGVITFPEPDFSDMIKGD